MEVVEYCRGYYQYFGEPNCFRRLKSEYYFTIKSVLKVSFLEFAYVFDDLDSLWSSDSNCVRLNCVRLNCVRLNCVRLNCVKFEYKSLKFQH